MNYLIHDTSRIRRMLFDQEMRPHGVTHMQWTTLAQLSRSKTGAMAQADLAALLGVGKVAVSRMIDRMVANGLVERRPDRDDRRVNLIHPTSKAEGILNRMTEVSRKLNRELLEGLSEEQISAMEHALATIKKNARNLLRSEEVTEEG
ncbi:MarR family winged helix-turn-helix transcriptional regulator [Neoroseomonas soli]|uniref:MarR family transcriptional regulator n=1 Tax=Neoroseomonas soli TaxID=1081025 RepID=A0A9X9WZX1_9PROT|nr:MarR family transcriptional regulator [Neoroseomonas soli]